MPFLKDPGHLYSNFLNSMIYGGVLPLVPQDLRTYHKMSLKLLPGSLLILHKALLQRAETCMCVWYKRGAGTEEERVLNQQDGKAFIHRCKILCLVIIWHIPSYFPHQTFSRIAVKNHNLFSRYKPPKGWKHYVLSMIAIIWQLFMDNTWIYGNWRKLEECNHWEITWEIKSFPQWYWPSYYYD